MTRKIIIKLIDHDGSDIDRMIHLDEDDNLPNLQEIAESMLDILNTDFDTGKVVKVGGSKDCSIW